MPAQHAFDLADVEYPVARYVVAEKKFNSLVERDFPDFSVEQHAQEKAEAEGVSQETLPAKIWAGVRTVPEQLDLTGDGKISREGLEAAAGIVAEQAGQAWRKTSSLGKEDVLGAASSAGEAAVEMAKKAATFDYLDAARDSARKAKASVQGANPTKFRSGADFADSVKRCQAFRVSKTGVKRPK